MGNSVRHAFKDIISEFSSRTEVQATEYIKNLTAQQRYVAELWG